MRKETERLNTLVDWYKFKLDEIREAPVDSRPRKLSRLYQINEANKHLGVTITRAGTINPVNYLGYPPELELPEDNNEEDPFGDAPKPGSLPAGCKPLENRKWGFQDKMDHFCRQNRSNPPQSFLQLSLELNHHLSVYQMSQIIQLALM